MEQKLTVAVIPARGGSKGVPRKNVREVGGVPLIARAVAAARTASHIDRVFVSTDDTEIADAARTAGAEVITRPAEIAGDQASSESALLHALDVIERQGETVSTLVFLQATSPFIDSGALDDAISRVNAGTYDCAFSAFETYGFLWSRDGDGLAAAVNHTATHRPRRQDREPHYLETGAFYVMDAAGFRVAQHRFFGRIGIVEVAETTAIEIDDDTQLRIADALAPLFTSHSPGSAPGHHRSPNYAGIVAIVTDFDGVHTDDTALVDEDGHEFVRVSRSDGMGVSRLRSSGIPLLILSTESNPVVTARARKLQVPVLQNVSDKAGALREWCDAHDLPLENVAYLGNDVNDLEAMRLVGWPVAVADAREEVRRAARVTLTRNGGDGAVRELIEHVLAAANTDRTPR